MGKQSRWCQAASVVVLALPLLVLITGAVLLGVSLKKLESTQWGLKYDQLAKKLDAQVHSEGLHPGPPGFRFIVFPSIFTQEDLNTTCVSRDGIFIDCDITFQWVARKNSLVDIVKKYKDFSGFRGVVRGAALSGVHDGCALFNVSQYQEQRTDVQQAQQALATERLVSLGADLAQLSLRNLDTGEMWRTAVSEKEKARQDIGLATNERQQQLQIATTNFNISQQQAEITIANATREAQEITAMAQAQAHSIKTQFDKQAATLLAAKEALNLSTEGLISYMYAQAVSQGGHLDVAAPHPAKLVYEETG